MSSSGGNLVHRANDNGYLDGIISQITTQSEVTLNVNFDYSEGETVFFFTSRVLLPFSKKKVSPFDSHCEKEELAGHARANLAGRRCRREPLRVAR